MGQQVLLRNQGQPKLDPKANGPFTIEQVHANGTVTIHRAPFIMERLHIRWIMSIRM